MPVEKTIRAALRKLKSKDKIDVLDAVQELGSIGNESVIEELVSIRGHDPDIDKNIDVTILQILEGQAGLVREYRRSDSGYYKDVIIGALAEYEDMDLLDIYLDGLDLGTKYVRMAHITWLANFCKKHCREEPECRRRILEALISVMKIDTAAECRSTAAQQLGEIANRNDGNVIASMEAILEGRLWRTPGKPWKWSWDSLVRDEIAPALPRIKHRRS